MGLDLDADEIKKFFKSVDENHDNVLDYSEFKSALTSMQPDYVDVLLIIYSIQYFTIMFVSFSLDLVTVVVERSS